MMAPDDPSYLMLAAAGAMAWMLSQPLHAQAVEKPASFRLACPAVLPPGAVSMSTTPDGWTVSATNQRPFDGSGMLHGAPDEEGYLVPNSGSEKRPAGDTRSVRRWTFEIPHAYEKWVYCAYGPVQLARRIPVRATGCTATEESDRGRYAPTIFVCK